MKFTERKDQHPHPISIARWRSSNWPGTRTSSPAKRSPSSTRRSCAQRGGGDRDGAGRPARHRRRGWTEPTALAAARQPAACDVVALGDAPRRTVAAPRDPQAGTRTPLHAVAHPQAGCARPCTLDRYRREEKQRAALWPAETLDGDPESIWVSEQMSELLARRPAHRRRPAPRPAHRRDRHRQGNARPRHSSRLRPRRPPVPSRSTAPPCRATCSRASCSATAAAPSPAPTAPSPASSARAAGGTLFLDEIAEIGRSTLQPKLLRFLETHEIHPLGESQPVKVDVRVIAATNADLESSSPRAASAKISSTASTSSGSSCRRCASGARRFRRWSTTTCRQFADEQKKGRLTLNDETLEYLLLYAWPGNVRQLANEVRRMVALADADCDPHAGAALAGDSGVAPDDPRGAGRRARDPRPDRSAAPVAVDLLEQTMVRRALDTRARERRRRRADARHLAEGPVPEAPPLGPQRGRPD